MIDIKTQYAGLTLRNPLIVGSSGLTNNPERNKEFEKAGAERLFSNLFLKNKLKCKAIRLCRIQTIRKLPIISVVM